MKICCRATFKIVLCLLMRFKTVGLFRLDRDQLSSIFFPYLSFNKSNCQDSACLAIRANNRRHLTSTSPSQATDISIDRLDIYDARSIFFQLSISNLNLMVGKYWSWYNCSASGRADLSTAASTVWICACKSTDWWPAEGCSLQLQPPLRLRRTSSYARENMSNRQANISFSKCHKL